MIRNLAKGSGAEAGLKSQASCSGLTLPPLRVGTHASEFIVTDSVASDGYGSKASTTRKPLTKGRTPATGLLRRDDRTGPTRPQSKLQINFGARHSAEFMFAATNARRGDFGDLKAQAQTVEVAEDIIARLYVGQLSGSEHKSGWEVFTRRPVLDSVGGRHGWVAGRRLV